LTCSSGLRTADGDGSLPDFQLKLKRLFACKGAKHSCVSAKCPDGHLDPNVKNAIFKNEANAPGAAPTTKFKGTLIRPCTPKS
jgi:hypothetical protein